MGLLSKIFKKKPGGSGIGNLLRKTVNTVTLGLAGNGKRVKKTAAEEALGLSAEDWEGGGEFTDTVNGDGKAPGFFEKLFALNEESESPFDLRKLFNLPAKTKKSDDGTAKMFKVGFFALVGVALLYLIFGRGKKR